MELKAIPTTTYTHVYVADDGKEFSDRQKCEAYEREKEKEKLWDILASKINTKANGYAPFDGCEHYEDRDYRWFYIETDEELKTLSELIENVIVEPLPFWACVESIMDYYDCSCNITTLNDSINYAEELLKKLGYKITVEKL